MSYARKDAGGGREAFGNFTVLSQHPHRVYSPKSSTAGKLTEIKLFCAVDTDGEFIPQVVPVDGDPMEGISDAFHAVEYVSFLGSRKFQFVTDTTDFPDKDSPSKIFYNKLGTFVKEEGSKARPEWAEWLKWGGQASLPLCVMMAQGVLIKLDGEACTDKNTGAVIQIAPIIMAFQRSATMDMENKLIQILDKSQPLSALNSEMGDITTPETGRTVLVDSFLNAESRKRYTVRAGEPVKLADKYVKETFVPWDNLLRVESAAWQIARLCESFDSASVDYAFRSDPEYAQFIPEHVKGAFDGKPATVNVPGTTGPIADSIGSSSVADAKPVVKPPAPPVTPIATPQEPLAVPVETPALNIISPSEIDAAPVAVNDGTANNEDVKPTALDENPIMKSLIAEKEAALARANG